MELHISWARITLSCVEEQKTPTIYKTGEESMGMSQLVCMCKPSLNTRFSKNLSRKEYFMPCLLPVVGTRAVGFILQLVPNTCGFCVGMKWYLLGYEYRYISIHSFTSLATQAKARSFAKIIVWKDFVLKCHVITHAALYGIRSQLKFQWPSHFLVYIHTINTWK